MDSQTHQITADEVYQAISEKADVAVVDVRTPQEYEKGKIAGSINIPLDKINDKVAGAIPDVDETIYVYCLSGSRSDIAINTLLELGYQNVFSMAGGLLMWRSKHYPLS